MNNPNEKPGIEERYVSATHATSLVVTAERGGAGDMLIAAGWSGSRVGAALLRLASEWDASEKPLPVRQDGVSALAMELAKQGNRRNPDENDWRAARDQAANWLFHENKILLGKLKTLREVREQLGFWVERKSMKGGQDAAATAILFWLDPNCKVCHGRRFETIKDTPTLSGRNCPSCRGSGHRPMRGGVEIPALLGYIEDCASAARQQMKKRLQHFDSQPVAQK
jgi:hypothetical protein